MKATKLKFFVGIITFILGISAASLVTYRVLNFENSNSEITHSFEIEKTEQSVKPEKEVYSAVLNELFLNGDYEHLTISDKTSFYSKEYFEITSAEQRIRRMKENYDWAAEETLRDYEMKMHKTSKLNYDFELPIKYTFINKEDLEKAKKDSVAFNKKYSDTGNLIEFSAIGFNSEKTQAFVDVEVINCPLCGFGSSLLLEKIDGKWKVIKNYGGWVS